MDKLFIIVFSILSLFAFCSHPEVCASSECNSGDTMLVVQKEKKLLIKNKLNKGTIDKIDNLILSGIDAEVFPGAVVLVTQGNEVKFRKAYGNCQKLPKKVKMTEETLFDVASMTKCIVTNTAIMQLIEQRKIGLYDPVKKYIPNFKPWVNGKDTVHITIQQLLTHSSGLSAGIGVAEAKRLRNKWNGYSCNNTVEYIATETARNFRPGSKSLYSCLNFITLQGIVERITKITLAQYSHEKIFQPLGMEHSFFFIEGTPIPDKIQIAPTGEKSDGTPHCGQVHDPLARILNGGNSGNAGLFINADDVARFSMSLLSGMCPILSEATIKLMATVPKADSPNVGRVLGWELNSGYAGAFNKHKCICHTGYTGTSIVMDLDSKTTIILLTNRVHPYDTSAGKSELMKIRRKLSDILSAELL